MILCAVALFVIFVVKNKNFIVMTWPSALQEHCLHFPSLLQMLCSKNIEVNACLVKVLEPSVWGEEGASLRNYSSFKWKFYGFGVYLFICFALCL